MRVSPFTASRPCRAPSGRASALHTQVVTTQKNHYERGRYQLCTGHGTQQPKKHKAWRPHLFGSVPNIYKGGSVAAKATVASLPAIALPTQVTVTAAQVAVAQANTRQFGIAERYRRRRAWAVRSSGVGEVGSTTELAPAQSYDSERPELLELLQASSSDTATSQAEARQKVQESFKRRKQQQFTYQASAIVATFGMAFLAVGATYYRFAFTHPPGADFPVVEFCATLLLVFGGVVGMEMWARYAHKALWHDYAPGWALHKSHHEPRIGPFEANDVFAIANAVPAMGLCLFGLLTPNILGGICFGSGLGITLFGIMYMFVHDGLVHRRFPVGPIAEVPYLKRVAVAHKMHHAEKYNGVPWGMFLGPLELEAVGAKDELDRLVAEADKQNKRRQMAELLEETH